MTFSHLCALVCVIVTGVVDPYATMFLGAQTLLMVQGCKTLQCFTGHNKVVMVAIF